MVTLLRVIIDQFLAIGLTLFVDCTQKVCCIFVFVLGFIIGSYVRLTANES